MSSRVRSRARRARTLRGVTAGTTLAFLGAGALPVLVIARADELGSATAGAALMAVMAGGALAGALLLAARADEGPGSERRAVAARVAERNDSEPRAVTARVAAGNDTERRAVAARVAERNDSEPRAVTARVAAGLGRPERRVVVSLVAVGLALAAGALGPGLVALGAGLALAGVADGVLLPAILAVRAGHSRRHERGAVFTTAASLKVGAGAVGAALGGLLVTATGAMSALLAVAALQLAGAAICAVVAAERPANGGHLREGLRRLRVG
jgi:MFS family permease